MCRCAQQHVLSCSGPTEEAGEGAVPRTRAVLVAAACSALLFRFDITGSSLWAEVAAWQAPCRFGRITCEGLWLVGWGADSNPGPVLGQQVVQGPCGGVIGVNRWSDIL
jgi:hypothetical protein